MLGHSFVADDVFTNAMPETTLEEIGPVEIFIKNFYFGSTEILSEKPVKAYNILPVLFKAYWRNVATVMLRSAKNEISGECMRNGPTNVNT